MNNKVVNTFVFLYDKGIFFRPWLVFRKALELYCKDLERDFVSRQVYLTLNKFQ